MMVGHQILIATQNQLEQMGEDVTCCASPFTFTWKDIIIVVALAIFILSSTIIVNFNRMSADIEW